MPSNPHIRSIARASGPRHAKCLLAVISLLTHRNQLPGCTPASPKVTQAHSHCLFLGHIFHTWKKRFFVLDEQLLKYYKSSDEGSSSETPNLSELKGCINLLNCKVQAIGPADGESRPNCFRVTPMSNKVRLTPPTHMHQHLLCPTHVSLARVSTLWPHLSIPDLLDPSRRRSLSRPVDGCHQGELAAARRRLRSAPGATGRDGGHGAIRIAGAERGRG